MLVLHASSYHINDDVPEATGQLMGMSLCLKAQLGDSHARRMSAAGGDIDTLDTMMQEQYGSQGSLRHPCIWFLTLANAPSSIHMGTRLACLAVAAGRKSRQAS